MYTLNQSIVTMPPSKSIVMMGKVKQMKREDPGILDFSGGEPDFDTPQRVKDELFKWVSAGYTHYTVGPGLPELRERICRKLKEENGIDCAPDGIMVTPGGKFAVYAAVRTIVNPGDEVIILDPAWVSYASIVLAANAVPVHLQLRSEEGYAIRLEALEKVCTDRTKLIIINYPNNPTGKVLSADDAEALRRFMLRHPDLLMLADDMYERITYTGFRHIAMGAFPDIAARVVTVNGFSKSLAMTGWRMGYLAADPALTKAIYRLFQHTISCVSGFIQKAGVAALDCTEEIEAMRKSYEHRRGFFIPGLNELPGVSALEPEGAFYAWVKFNVPGIHTCEEMCDFLLTKARVATVPGNAYGCGEDVCLRFSFATAEDDLREALVRMRTALESVR